MLVSEARAIARSWVLAEAGNLPGFHGAYIAGSTGNLPEDVVYPPSSDLDVKVVMDEPPDTGGPQKHIWDGLVLDVSYAPTEDYRLPETILGSYYTAVHFMSPSILLDPTGNLAAIQAIVRRDYARRQWARTRCEHVRREVERVLGWLDPASPLHEQVLIWVIAMSVATHLVLVADLRNPTFRRGLVVMREVLGSYGDTSLHEQILAMLGSADMRQEDVEALLAACTEAFDAASVVRTTPFLMGSNISTEARPTAIGGIEELIAAGYHRESVLWILLIHTLSQTALQSDAPQEIRSRLAPGYEHLLGTLAIASSADLVARHDALRRIVPALWEVTEDILARNPAITD